VDRAARGAGPRDDDAGCGSPAGPGRLT
jgi:hypothetical protein